MDMHAFVGPLFIDTTCPRCLTTCLTCEYKVYTRDIWYKLSVMWKINDVEVSPPF